MSEARSQKPDLASRLLPPASCLLLLASCLLIGGCFKESPPPIAPPWPPPSPPLFRHVPDDEITLPWGQEEPFLIVVEKSCHKLNLYSYGRLVNSYPAVFGRKRGGKLYEGDMRTPTGLYMIIGKKHHRRWARFMLLDYPTGHDVHTYWQNVTLGGVPRIGGRYPGVGGAIGIHGTDKEKFNRLGINWTLGCISLFNQDMKGLYEQVPDGTLVYIKD